MKKVLLVVVGLSLSALAGCTADTTEGPASDEGSRNTGNLILVDQKTPIVLPADKIDQRHVAIRGEMQRDQEFEVVPELWKAENVDLPLEPKRELYPCQACVRGEDPIQP
jgi:hypothetical protein